MYRGGVGIKKQAEIKGSGIRGQGSAPKKEKRRGILTVQILETKPNPMFTEEQRRMVRFLRFNRTVPCTECGKRRKIMWTMLCEFYAHSMGELVLKKSMKIHKPMDEVCGDHLLAPAWPGEEKTEEVQP